MSVSTLKTFLERLSLSKVVLLLCLASGLTLYPSSVDPVRAAGSDPTPGSVLELLKQEVGRLTTRTISDVKPVESGINRRSLQSYRELLDELYTALDQGVENDRLFRLLGEVLEQYNSLAEILGGKESTLDSLKDAFEEQREHYEEENLTPRTDWFREYTTHLNRNRDLERHHRLVVDLFGLMFASDLSEAPGYRLDLYRDHLEGLFPSVLLEITTPNSGGNHATRLYRRTYHLARDGTGADTADRRRFEDAVRGHARVLRHLRRIGYRTGPSERLLETLDEEFRFRSPTDYSWPH